MLDAAATAYTTTFGSNPNCFAISMPSGTTIATTAALLNASVSAIVTSDRAMTNAQGELKCGTTNVLANHSPASVELRIELIAMAPPYIRMTPHSMLSWIFLQLT